MDAFELRPRKVSAVIDECPEGPTFRGSSRGNLRRASRMRPQAAVPPRLTRIPTRSYRRGMSFHTPVPLLLAFGCFAVLGCSSSSESEEGTDTGGSSTAAPADGSAGRGSSSSDGGSDAPSTADSGSSSGADGSSSDSGGAVVASWDIDSDMVINGLSVQDAIQSAVAIHSVLDGQDYLSVIVTDVPSFCEKLVVGDCGVGPHFKLAVDLVGLEPGTYDLTAGVASGVSGDVPMNCVGGGFGADSGSATFTSIDVGPNGGVAVEFDAQFLAGAASGTIVAPICVVE